MKQKITQISLLGSSDCDLNCSYCYLGKNKIYKEQDKFIRQAWETGEYLKTVEQVLQKLNSDPLLIRDFQIWGGEPTLYIKTIAKWGQAIGKLFPNLYNILIPTNFFKTDIKALIDFIYELDKTITPRNSTTGLKKMSFHIQGSVDGLKGDFNEFGHKVPFEQYKKNIDDLFDYLTTKPQLNNIIIHLEVCPNSTQYLILKNLNTYDKIKEFRKDSMNAINYITDKINQTTNAQMVILTRYWTPRIAISQQTTSEEAQDINKLIKLLNLCDYAEDMMGIEYGDNSTFYHDCTAETYYNSRNHECVESNEESITLMPDGTIAECPCLFYHNLPEFKEEFLKTNNFWEYKSCLIRKGSFYNPLTNEGISEKYHDWYVYGGGYLGTHSTYINLNFNMAQEMALSWQIDYMYAYNPKLLLDHYLAAFMSSECYRENVNVNHNHFIADHNQFRRWFNGATEYSYNMRKYRIERILEGRLKENNDL